MGNRLLAQSSTLLGPICSIAATALKAQGIVGTELEVSKFVVGGLIIKTSLKIWADDLAKACHSTASIMTATMSHLTAVGQLQKNKLTIGHSVALLDKNYKVHYYIRRS